MSKKTNWTMWILGGGAVLGGAWLWSKKDKPKKAPPPCHPLDDPPEGYGCYPDKKSPSGYSLLEIDPTEPDPEMPESSGE